MKRRWTSPLLIFIPAMMIAALALGYFSYRNAAELSRKSNVSLKRSVRVLGVKLVDRIERMIIDSDRIFFRLVSLDDPGEFRALWRRIVRVSEAVESVIVLDDHHHIVHLIANVRRRKRRAFRKLFETQILPDMDLDRIKVYRHTHLHKSYNNRSYLLSYIRRQAGDRDFFVALNINLPFLISDIFRQEFRKLEETYSIAVMDQRGHVLYGKPIAQENSLVVERRFPTTLYKWRLQIAPRYAGSLTDEARTRRLSDILLVGSAVGIIWVGMLVLLIAVRKEQRANELKSEFVSNVSHELKTPLSLIRMFAELMAIGRARDGQTHKEYAEIIVRESDRLAQLIDNVLDFARIERGKAAYEMAKNNLVSVIERVADLCRYRSEQANVTLRTEVLGEIPELVFDESAITLLLFNLVENALKYAAVTESEILMSVSTIGERVCLRVVDHGPGIPKEELNRIFERFFRGRAARQGGQRGSGIGLSLVEHIAEAHGGGVAVKSEPGTGTTFEVVFPILSERRSHELPG